jgi:hypothetical protein
MVSFKLATIAASGTDPEQLDAIEAIYHEDDDHIEATRTLVIERHRWMSNSHKFEQSRDEDADRHADAQTLITNKHRWWTKARNGEVRNRDSHILFPSKQEGKQDKIDQGKNTKDKVKTRHGAIAFVDSSSPTRCKVFALYSCHLVVACIINVIHRGIK